VVDPTLCQYRDVVEQSPTFAHWTGLMDSLASDPLPTIPARP